MVYSVLFVRYIVNFSVQYDGDQRARDLRFSGHDIELHRRPEKLMWWKWRAMFVHFDLFSASPAFQKWQTHLETPKPESSFSYLSTYGIYQNVIKNIPHHLFLEISMFQLWLIILWILHVSRIWPFTLNTYYCMSSKYHIEIQGFEAVFTGHELANVKLDVCCCLRILLANHGVNLLPLTPSI